MEVTFKLFTDYIKLFRSTIFKKVRKITLQHAPKSINKRSDNQMKKVESRISCLLKAITFFKEEYELLCSSIT